MRFVDDVRDSTRQLEATYQRQAVLLQKTRTEYEAALQEAAKQDGMIQVLEEKIQRMQLAQTKKQQDLRTLPPTRPVNTVIAFLSA